MGITKLGACLAAAALAPAFAAGAEPVRAPAPSADLAFQSVFDGYRPFAATPSPSWRQANEIVQQRGGRKAYANEAAAAADQPPRAAGRVDPQAAHCVPAGEGVQAPSAHAGHAMRMPADRAPHGAHP